MLGLWDGHGRGVACAAKGRLIFSFSGTGKDRGFPAAEIQKGLAVLKEIDRNNRVAGATAGKFGRAPLRALDGLFKSSRAAEDPLLAAAILYRRYESVIAAIPALRHAESRLGLSFMKRRARKEGMTLRPLMVVEHHLAHSACAFYQSPFDRALVMTQDCYGDGLSGMVSSWDRKSGLVETVEKFSYLRSIAYVFGLFTRTLGFEEGEEASVESLAAQGRPDQALSRLLEKIIHLGGPGRGHDGRPLIRIRPELIKPGVIARFDKADAARALQDRIEKCVSALVDFYCRKPRHETLCFAGGLFLNRGARRVIKEMLGERFSIPSKCGDNGLAEGAALFVSAMRGTA